MEKINFSPIPNISPSYSSSIYSRGEYNTLKWRSESIVYGSSIHNCKKISTLKISVEACSLIFLLWGITCKKMPPYLLRNKWHAQPALHALWRHRKLVYSEIWSKYFLSFMRHGYLIRYYFTKYALLPSSNCHRFWKLTDYKCFLTTYNFYIIL